MDAINGGFLECCEHSFSILTFQISFVVTDDNKTYYGHCRAFAGDSSTMAVNNHSQHLYCPNSLHFFKIILEATIQSRKLRLPKPFVRRLGKSLCDLDAVGLEVPTGEEWEVGIQIGDDGEVWLEKGWVEFASFYNVQYGDLLVFRCEFGSPKFQVMIFDKTTTEIQYAVRLPRSSSTPIKVEPQNDDSPEKVTSNRCVKSSRGGHEASPSNLGEEEETVVRKQSTNLYFEMVIQPSFVHHRYGWWLPQKFVQEYIKDEDEEGEIKLIGSSPNGKSKTWVLKYSMYFYGERVDGSNRKRARGSNLDWKAFVDDNQLVVGDVCVFERIESCGNFSPLSFKITVRRATQKDHEKLLGNQNQYRAETTIADRTRCSKRKLMQPQKREESAKRSKDNKELIVLDPEEEETSDGTDADKQQQRPGSAFVSNYPFFQATVSQSSLAHRRLYVKGSFVKDNINTELEEQTAILESGGNQSWSVIFRHKHNQTYFNRLRDFLEENNVKVGDVCTFELVDKKNRKFRASISRSDEAAHG